jgi:hypothetical protein
MIAYFNLFSLDFKVKASVEEKINFLNLDLTQP